MTVQTYKNVKKIIPHRSTMILIDKILKFSEPSNGKVLTILKKNRPYFQNNKFLYIFFILPFKVDNGIFASKFNKTFPCLFNSASNVDVFKQSKSLSKAIFVNNLFIFVFK